MRYGRIPSRGAEVRDPAAGLCSLDSPSPYDAVSLIEVPNPRVGEQGAMHLQDSERRLYVALEEDQPVLGIEHRVPPNDRQLG